MKEVQGLCNITKEGNERWYRNVYWYNCYYHTIMQYSSNDKSLKTNGWCIFQLNSITGKLNPFKDSNEEQVYLPTEDFNQISTIL